MKRTLEEAIKYYSELAEENEKDAEQFKQIKATQDMISHCYECAEEHRQLAKWLKELKAYKELSTYNRPNKCSECEFEDSEYYCDDCIWNFVDKFKLKEVNADE